MKINFKNWIAALACLASLGAAQAAELQFSTEAEPVWYSIKFTNGGWALADKGVDQNIQTAAAADVDAQKWQLIGNADEFKLRSKSGNYVKWGGSRFTAAAEATNLYVAKINDKYEIGRIGSDKHFNMWAGAGEGHDIGEYNSGDIGNGLKFYDADGNEAPLPVVIPVGELPKFSTEGESTYYYIQFLRGGNVLASQGSGNSCLRKQAVPADGQLWKVTGVQDNCQFVNAAGEYLTMDGAGEGSVKTAAEPYAPGFALVPAGEESYFKNWEIMDNGATDEAKKYVNQFGGTRVDGKFGLWTYGDVNNALAFVLPLHMEFGEYTIKGSTTYRPEHKSTLWYTAPGADWENWGLPVGNGMLGAQVLGGVIEDEISFTEKTLWSGGKDDHGASNMYGYGTFHGFGNVLVGVPAGNGFGWDEATAVKDYYRALDLETATAIVGYKSADGQTEYKREIIASNPDGCIAMNFTASTPGSLALKFKVIPGTKEGLTATYADGTAKFNDKFETISYAATLKVIPDGGTMTTDENGIVVTGANSVLAILVGATDYDPISPSYTSGTDQLLSNVDATVDAAVAKGWDAIYSDHVADHQSLFNRVTLEFDGAVNDRPTNDLKGGYGIGTASVARMLEQLYFQYGRYLAIGSSRGIDVPNNLQGIWSGHNVYRKYNGSNLNPWNADIHANINIQMNYWPVESTNLSELHMPFLNYIINQATVQPQWRENVTKYVSNPKATKGWALFVENSIFGAGSNWGNNYVVGNGWYCSHLWQHYLYTLDKEFLARALPAMWGACEFWIERLKLAADGTYECPNEASPEHGPNQDAVAHAQQIVAELFANTIDAIAVIGEENCGIAAEDIALLKDRYEKMDKGLHTEEFTAASGWDKNGVKEGDLLLREWKYSPYTSGQNGHRHLSHLMALHPFNQVEAGTELYTAAVNSLKQRGDGATGWSMGWKINQWARAQDGNHAHTILKNALQGGCSNNLYDQHPPFQIDGNFGATSGITEMLMQSHSGIHLLPALPTAWKKGSVTGLKAQGDMTVDLSWEKKKVSSATITANQGGDVKIINADIDHIRIDVDGVTVEPEITVNPITGTRTIMIPAVSKGAKVSLNYDAEYTNPNVQEPEDSLSEISASDMELSVSGDVVTVSGASSLQVFDIAGRTIARAAGSSVKLPAAGAVLVKAISAQGASSTFKVVI